MVMVFNCDGGGGYCVGDCCCGRRCGGGSRYAYMQAAICFLLICRLHLRAIPLLKIFLDSRLLRHEYTFLNQCTSLRVCIVHFLVPVSIYAYMYCTLSCTGAHLSVYEQYCTLSCDGAHLCVYVLYTFMNGAHL